MTVLTKREYFAAHAPYTFADAVQHICQPDDNGIQTEIPTYENVINQLCLMRLKYADTMIQMLEETRKR